MGRTSSKLPQLVRSHVLGCSWWQFFGLIILTCVLCGFTPWENGESMQGGIVSFFRNNPGERFRIMEVLDAASMARAAAKIQLNSPQTTHTPVTENSTVDLDDSVSDRLHIAQIHAFPHSKERRIISFSLYGENPKYFVGAVRNAELVRIYFPGWTARYYLDATVPTEVVRRLKYLGADVVMMHETGAGAIAGMFWRFLVADDPTVDRYIVRDTDSRLNARDRLAVEEWITSGVPIHSIRDSIWHCHPLNGGMWGGVNGAIKDMATKMAQWSRKSTYGEDMDFLNQYIWPLVQDKQVSHDAYCCEQFPNTRPFPSKRYASFQHVGQVFNCLDEPVQSHIDDIRLKTVSETCRKHPTWLYG